jgi:hypothetical protein
MLLQLTFIATAWQLKFVKEDSVEICDLLVPGHTSVTRAQCMCYFLIAFGRAKQFAQGGTLHLELWSFGPKHSGNTLELDSPHFDSCLGASWWCDLRQERASWVHFSLLWHGARDRHSVEPSYHFSLACSLHVYFCSRMFATSFQLFIVQEAILDGPQMLKKYLTLY